MSAATNGKTTGVQELIDRIRGEGVSAATQESNRILAQARKEAAAVKAAADAEARAIMQKAKAQIATERAAAQEAIRNAARDSLLELRSQVRAAFEVHVHRLVSLQAQEPEFVKSLVLVLAGEAAAKHIKDKDAEILVSAALAAPGDATATPEAARQKVHNTVLGAMGGMLREGITLMADDKVKGGARVKLVGEKLEIDMTDESLTRLLLKNLLPRYAAIVQGEKGTS